MFAPGCSSGWYLLPHLSRWVSVSGCSRARGFSELQRRVCPCVSGCGTEGQDFPNGARVPTADRCQECTCVVCHLHSHHITCCVQIIWRSFHLKVHCWPYCSYVEWKCGMFSLPLSCLVLSAPRSSCRRLLPAVNDLITLTQVIRLLLSVQRWFKPEMKHLKYIYIFCVCV